MNTPIRLAFIGVDHPHGAHWRELLRNFHEQLTITAIVPEFGGALTSLEEIYTDLPRFRSIEHLIADAAAEFDAAVVCLPNNQGPPAVTALANAGKHILCEKPVGRNAAEIRQMAEVLVQSGVAFQNGFVWRYDDAANRLRHMLQDGRFGKLFSVEMTYVTSDVIRRGPNHYLFDAEVSGGGFFSWLACHHLDLLLYITGQSVIGVTARVGQFTEQSTDVEDGGTAILELSDGGIATFTGGYWLPRWAGEMRFCFRGTQRWVHWDPTRPGTSGVLEIHGPKPQWHAMEEVFSLPEDHTKGYGGVRGLNLVRDWIQSILVPGTPCRNTPQSTLAALQLTDAIYESSRTERRVACSIGPT